MTRTFIPIAAKESDEEFVKRVKHEKRLEAVRVSVNDRISRHNESDKDSEQGENDG